MAHAFDEIHRCHKKRFAEEIKSRKKGGKGRGREMEKTKKGGMKDLDKLTKPLNIFRFLSFSPFFGGAPQKKRMNTEQLFLILDIVGGRESIFLNGFGRLKVFLIETGDVDNCLLLVDVLC